MTHYCSKDATLVSANRRPVVDLAHTKLRVGKIVCTLKSGPVEAGPTRPVTTALRIGTLCSHTSLMQQVSLGGVGGVRREAQLWSCSRGLAREGTYR